ncbi:glycosyltransferase [Hyphococcus sp.]|uniref:glycosyltransferase n=1 Tax=Hyphococcus sp. TaxID=2038636 RepID=UPI00208024EF|nr:MAG: hypothetical protein DHS20C04_26500 [Marinicaulis sp.]
MRILHISHSDKNGGAAIGAYRLHHAMRSRGVESDMFVVHKLSNDLSIRSIINSDNQLAYRASLAAAQDIRDLYGVESAPIRTFNLSGVDLADMINEHPSEIVQLHWIANNTLKLSDLRKIKKPIVWKMPDMWPFCGGEHYIRQGDPRRHVLGYDKTEPFNGEGVDVNRLVWEAKRQYYADLPLTITSPSHFLAKEAHESILFRDYDAHVIPNPLPWQFLSGPAATEAEKLELRQGLSLPLNKLLVMFSAFSSKERRKGFHHVEEMVLRRLPALLPPEKIAFVICGAAQTGVDNIANYDVFKFQGTDNVELYKSYLRAIDLLLFPSEMDSTAMVVQEALSQGVPSIVFDVGGLPEMVVHEKNGYVAKPYEAADLASGLEWWLNCSDRKSVSAFAMERSRNMHNPAVTVERYLQVYDQAISRYRAGKSFKSGVFYDEPAPVKIRDHNPRAIIVDPSAVSAADSSHHAEHVMAFAAIFSASKIDPVVVSNAAATFDNPLGATEKSLSWTIYDKIRVDRDKRDGPAVDGAAIERFDANSAKSDEIFCELERLHEAYRLDWRDAVVFPTTDRFSIEGVLQFIYSNPNHDSPSFHLNLMFEKADFLLGRYPLAELMHALRRSAYLRRKVFLYAETRQMADDLSAAYNIHVFRLPPPGLFSDNQLRAIKAYPEGAAAGYAQVQNSYAKACQVFDAGKSGERFTAPSGKRIIASLGRGRRDKGWGVLPDIVEAFNKTPGDENTVFVVQRPRKMDNLEAQEKRMEAFSNVVLLDEIISQELLDDICQKAAAFLLPYEPGVYRNRGSAFGWRAVLNAKPLVVTAGTALCETLLENTQENDAEPSASLSGRFRFLRRKGKGLSGEKYLNGKAATGAANFASALRDVLANLSAYENGAEKMRAAYFASIVPQNPIIEAMKAENFASLRHTLVLKSASGKETPPDDAQQAFQVDVVYSEDNSALPPSRLGETDSTGSLRIGAVLRDGALHPDELPEFLRKALDNARIDAIYTPYAFAVSHGGLRYFPPTWQDRVKLY